MNCGVGIEVPAGDALAHSVSIKAGSSAANLYEIAPLSDSRWEVLISTHPQASVFHSTKWLRSLQTAYGYEPAVITTCSRGTALTNGLVFCRVKSWLTGRRLVSLPFSDHCEPLASNLVEMDDLLGAMRQNVEAGKWKYVEIRPTSYQPALRTGLRKSLTYRIHSLDLE